MNHKVSILTAVYNGEKYVARYLESIVNQTYKNIELIIIDDGSTDNTKNIIMQYMQNNNGVEFIYMHKENGGQASAIAQGIKKVTGEYLIWADADDYYELNAIEKMVTYLEKNEDVDLVRCNAIEIKEKNLKVKKRKLKVSEPYKSKQNVFEDSIFIRGISCFPGVYMVKFEKYKQNNPNLYIYEGREGQNMQLLLPASYNNKCYFLEEYLYNYVVHKDSHSHQKKNYYEQITRNRGLEEIIIKTIKMLELDEKYSTNLVKKVNDKYNKNIYELYCKIGDKEKTKEFYKKLEKKNLKLKILYIVGTNKIAHIAYKCFKIFKPEKF